MVLRVTSHGFIQIQDELHTMLKEVRYFAALRDPHILQYNHSWIEYSYKKYESEKENNIEVKSRHKENYQMILRSPLPPHFSFEENEEKIFEEIKGRSFSDSWGNNNGGNENQLEEDLKNDK